jgi:hypothetical protein
MAQQNDAGAWLSATFQKKINKKNSVLLSQEVRLNENMSETDNVFSEVSYAHSITKRLDASGSIRYINKHRLDNSYSQRWRYMITLKYTQPVVKKLDLVARARWQQQWNDIGKSDDWATAINTIRMGVGACYQLKKKIGFDFFYEYFFSLNNKAINNTRATLAAGYKMNNNHSIEIGLIYQKSKNTNNPVQEGIMVIGYKYKL